MTLFSKQEVRVATFCKSLQESPRYNLYFHSTSSHAQAMSAPHVETYGTGNRKWSFMVHPYHMLRQVTASDVRLVRQYNVRRIFGVRSPYMATCGARSPHMIRNCQKCPLFVSNYHNWPHTVKCGDQP